MQEQGSSTYLDHLARSLAAGGAEVHLRILAPRRDQLRLGARPGFLDPYRSVALRGTWRRGRRSTPGTRGTGSGARGGAPVRSGPWTLLRPEPAAAAWAAAEVRGSRPTG